MSNAENNRRSEIRMDGEVYVVDLFENNKLVLLRDPIINTQENIKKKHNET